MRNVDQSLGVRGEQKDCEAQYYLILDSLSFFVGYTNKELTITATEPEHLTLWATSSSLQLQPEATQST